jgi:putative pyruvate formate lyase activating enzyme
MVDMDGKFGEYKNCTLCPRSCGTDRTVRNGFCGEGSGLSIDAALLHHGEEPPVSFRNGSGTVFFTGCSLRCPFCQNMQISQNNHEKKIYSMNEFVGLMKGLIDKKAENLNFVTPDHFLPHILEGVRSLRDAGESIPTVYNCSGYQNISSLEKAVDLMDIFLFDYKFADKDVSAYLVGTPDYPDVALKALEFLYRKKGNLVCDPEGKAVSGIIVRHLVMPDLPENSIKAINDLYFDFGPDVYLSLMSQYSPHYLKEGYDRINRKLRKDEYEPVLELADRLGFKGYFQQLEGTAEAYLPDFTDEDVFKTGKD